MPAALTDLTAQPEPAFTVKQHRRSPNGWITQLTLACSGNTGMEWEAEEDTYTVGEERDRAHVNESKPGVITMLFSKKWPQIF